MEVPVWDPSGEALIEVTDSATGEEFRFWMLYRDSGWLVADEA